MAVSFKRLYTNLNSMWGKFFPLFIKAVYWFAVPTIFLVGKYHSP